MHRVFALCVGVEETLALLPGPMDLKRKDQKSNIIYC